MSAAKNQGGLAIAAVAVLAMGILFAGSGPPADAARLVSVQQLPDATCEWPAAPLPDPQTCDSDDAAAVADPNLFALVQHEHLFGPPPGLLPLLQQGRTSAAIERVLTPLRTIRDSDPTYSAIALDLNSDEVVLQDNNLWEYRVFNRLDNTPPGVDQTPPKRVVRGDNTKLEFNNGLYIDPANGDIYSVESDIGDRMVVFSREANGDVAPKRILNTPHRVYNIAADETKQELFVTVEYPPEVVIYRKQASGDERPLRRIQGDTTGLDAPHGIAVDEKNRLLYINTWGHHSNFRIPGTGRFEPPAIKVYRLDASGDAAPVRVMTGESTQLNWPAAMKLNPDTGELYVANDIGQSVLVFSGVATAGGNLAPVRVLKGPKTRLSYPTGVFLDRKNREVWVSNLGNASATAYPLMASGDVAPVRVIRSAPEGKKSLNFGRTAAVAYDRNREQLLVPN